MTRTTIKQTLIEHGVTEVSGALLDALSAPQGANTMTQGNERTEYEDAAYVEGVRDLARMIEDCGTANWKAVVGVLGDCASMIELRTRERDQARLLDALTASGNDVLREALEEAKRRASLIAIVEQGCGGTLSFKEMANSAMLQGRELAEFIDTALSTTPTMSAEDMREAAAKECESYVTPWGRAGSAPDACEGAALECAKRIRSLPLTKEPTP